MILYLVVSQQKVKDGQTPVVAPRSIAGFPQAALEAARKILKEDCENCIVYSMQSDKVYQVSDSIGTEGNRSRMIVYVGWRISPAGELIERFYGEFKIFSLCVVQA